tara:strand:- start:481 stop:585 length:105 start_codon:yes stop_codon:yes gene_type:complete
LPEELEEPENAIFSVVVLLVKSLQDLQHGSGVAA